MPIPPHRIIAMHRYEIEPWYPFRSSEFRINDPKTTAAVGAMLCRVCEGEIEGFYMRSSELKMSSTARYIGIMNQRGEITDDNVLLHNVDLDTGENVEGFEVQMEGPTFIGFRQLPIARWKTTPLYYLSFRDADQAKKKLVPPITVQFKRQDSDDNEAIVEDFDKEDAVDAAGESCDRQIVFRLQTLRTDQGADMGYWLDSGILKTPRHA
jgi:hypothetical protein